jgi:hypothetical protein
MDVAIERSTALKGRYDLAKGVCSEGKGEVRFYDNSCQALSRKSPKGERVQTEQTSSTYIKYPVHGNIQLPD